MSLPPRFLVLSLAALTTLACGAAEDDKGSDPEEQGSGGTSGSGGSGASSSCEINFSAPDDLRLDALSQEQAVDLCLEAGEFYSCVLPEAEVCRFEGLVAARAAGADDPEVCRAEEARCLQEGSELQEELSDCSGPVADEGCSMTVGQLEECWRAQFARRRELNLPEWTCDDVAAYFEWSAEVADEPVLEECELLEECQ